MCRESHSSHLVAGQSHFHAGSYGFHYYLMYILFIHIILTISLAHEIIKTLNGFDNAYCPFKQLLTCYCQTCPKVTCLDCNHPWHP